MYYKAVMSNKIFNERSLSILDDIFGPGAFEAWVRAGALMPVKNLSVIDLLKNDQMFEATRLYHEIHEESTVKESLEMVKKIQADIDRFKNPKHCCSNCGFDCESKCSCVVPCNDCSEWVPKYD